MLWAKWIQRGLAGPSRSVGGRAGQYAAKKVFEMRLMNVVGQQTAIPKVKPNRSPRLPQKDPGTQPN